MFQLIEFSVANFRSFRERATFSLVASRKITSRDSRLDKANVLEVSEDLSVLRSAAIYGANASGKSNFLTAVRFMRLMVRNSSRETSASEPIAVEAFQLDGRKAPSHFEIVFLLEDTTYRYGFEVDPSSVHHEWLFATTTGKERKCFTRTAGDIEVSPTLFKEGKGLEDRTRPNALFLSVVAQFNGKTSTAIQSWFSKSLRLISGLDDVGYKSYTQKKCSNEAHRASIADFVRKMDVGIEDVLVSAVPLKESLPAEIPEDLRNVLLKHLDQETTNVTTVHKTFDSDGQPSGTVNFDIDTHESQGTKKIFSLAGPLLDTLDNGRVLFIDELDARLHPLITRSLVQLFNSVETNPKGSQLIFTTHDTNLLSADLLRRDQVWFCEKERNGGTKLYSLLEYKPRNDSSLAKNYIHGRYGAIPFVGDLTELLGSVTAE